MNARFRKGYCPDASFDARKIFEKYAEHEWGEYLIPEIHLCQTRRFDESGHYYCCSSLPLPGNMQAERASE
jgi:activating signal cointegrator complex subunit 1